MHFYWGDQPMSWLRYLTLKTFRAHNPHVEMVLHTSACSDEKPWLSHEVQDINHYHGYDWRENLPELSISVETHEADTASPVHLCDMTRWQVLADGGMFSDMDIFFTAPIDEYLPVLSEPSLICEGGWLYLGICGGGEPFGEVLWRAQSTVAGGYQDLGVEVLYRIAFENRLGMSWTEIAKHDTLALLSDKVGHISNIPKRWVLALDVNEVHRSPFPTDVLGVHWYGGLSESQLISATLTPENCTGSNLADLARQYI